MSVISSTYTFSTNTFVNYFDQGLQSVVDGLAVVKFGSQWEAIDAEIRRLPPTVTVDNAAATKTQLEKIIAVLKTTDLVKNVVALQTELSIIENILSTGSAAPLTNAVATYRTCKNALWYIWSFIKTPPASTQEQITQEVTRVTTAFNRVKVDMANLTLSQVKSLMLKPKSGLEVTEWMTRVSYEIKAQTFNTATLLAIRAIVYGILGIMGFKTMIATTAVFYLLRELADKSMSFTNYDSWTTPVAVVPIHIPYIPFVNSYVIPWINMPIPTLKGCKQIFVSSYNYLKSFLWNKGAWRPNFLEINNVVILKNGIVPLMEYSSLISRPVTPPAPPIPPPTAQ